MSSNLQYAKEVLEGILNRNWTEIDIAKRHEWSLHGIFALRKDLPEWRLHTENQLLMGLGNGWLAKTRTSPYMQEDGLCIFDMNNYEYGVSRLPEALRDLGLEFPEHHYVGTDISPERIRVLDSGRTFAIVPDLTEGGRYKVEDVQEAHFTGLANGTEIRRQFDKYVRLFQEIHEGRHPKYGLEVERHVDKEKGSSPDEAIRHMFFVQVNPTERTGRLILGDLDHTVIYQRPSPHK